jgi:hypothetical protein
MQFHVLADHAHSVLCKLLNHFWIWTNRGVAQTCGLTDPFSLSLMQLRRTTQENHSPDITLLVLHSNSGDQLRSGSWSRYCCRRSLSSRRDTPILVHTDGRIRRHKDLGGSRGIPIRPHRPLPTTKLQPSNPTPAKLSLPCSYYRPSGIRARCVRRAEASLDPTTIDFHGDGIATAPRYRRLPSIANPHASPRRMPL